MSLLNIKDLDILICKYLDDKDLINFSRVNKYYNAIFNEEKLWRQKILDLNIKKEYLCKNLDKKYYIELYKALKNEDFVNILYYSILVNRCDIVSMVFQKRNLNPNFYFVFKNFRNLRTNGFYYSKRQDKNLPFEYSPVNLSIKNGYYPMWNFFHSNYNLELSSDIYIVSIVSNNVDILKDVLKYNIYIEHWVLLFCVRCKDLDATKLLLERIEEKEIYDMVNFMIIDFKKEYTNWIDDFNSSFLEVLKKLDLEYVKRVSRNNEKFTNLLNFYITSINPQ